MSPTHSREARQEKEVSELNLWTRQWRAECISKARADFRQREAAYACLKDKTTDYALSLKRVRDTCAQVLAVWESSPSDLTLARSFAGEDRDYPLQRAVSERQEGR